MLGERELVSYLLERELISPQSVVSGGLAIANASSRNRNFKVLTDAGPCYMIKQSAERGKELGTLCHEAAIYRFLAAPETADGGRWFLPRYHHFDAEKNLLILELTPGAENVRQLQVRRRSFSRLLARRIGKALGTLHTVSLRGRDGGFEAAYRPWALTLGLPDSSILHDVSGANLDLLRTIQRYRSFARHLAELQRDWEPKSLVHGDFKWDNCVGFSAIGSERRTRLKIVDWEFAGVGDPCWDIGSVFGDYLSTWLHSIPVTDDRTPEGWTELAAFPLEAMHPSINTFWRAYCETVDGGCGAVQQRLMKSIRFCAARLLQSSYERMHQSNSLSGHVYCCLQLALNLLERPVEAAVHLLGLPLHEAFEP